MTERDSLLVRLEQVNPVPDPSRLSEDPEVMPPAAHFGDVGTRAVLAERSQTRHGLLVAAATAALIIVVVASISLIATDPNELAAGGDRILQLTIDGDSCLYEGPRMLPAGDVEIIYRNVSPETRWANTLRLDDDRSITDALAYIETDPFAGAPSWSSPVWLSLSVPTGGEPRSRITSLEPGTHLLLCGQTATGTWLGADILVTP